MKRLMSGFALAAILSACAKPIPPVVIDTGCDWTKKITWSPRDTPGTVKQVRERNAVRAKRCPQDEETNDEATPLDPDHEPALRKAQV